MDGSFNGGGDAFVTKLNASGALVYSTYIGGSSADCGQDISVDSLGAAYVAGRSQSSNFPAVNSWDSVLGGFVDAFVLKLAPAGNALTYSTYLGGDGDDEAFGIAVDGSGHAHVAGSTGSFNFPVHQAAQPVKGAGADGFLTRVSPAGNLLAFSTYIGGSSEDFAYDVAVDSAGNAYVVGAARSSDIAVTSLYSFRGFVDGFVAKVGPFGGPYSFFTYLGGGGGDEARGVAVDVSGALFVTGFTGSEDFPIVGAYSSTLQGGADAFITKLVNGAVTYSTYFGGSSGDQGRSVVVGSGGAIYLAGCTSSSDLPIYNAHDPQAEASGDGFLARLSPSGTTLEFSTFLSTDGEDCATSVQIDASGAMYVGGYAGPGFPLVSAADGAFGGSREGFVTKITDNTPPVTITLTTSPSGLPVEADGAGFLGPRTLHWAPGVTHTISAPELYQTFPTNYRFQSWSDGGARSHTVTTPATATTYTANYLAVPCTYGVSPMQVNVGPLGGAFSVRVTTDPTCMWRAEGHDWVQLQSYFNAGTGDATFGVEAFASPRSGTATVAGQTVTVQQTSAVCGAASALSPPERIVGGDFTSTNLVSVSITPGCPWIASGGSLWLAITNIQNYNGGGPGHVEYRANRNPGLPRVGTLSIGGRTFTLQQNGASVPGLGSGIFREGQWFLDGNQNGALENLNQSNLGDKSFQYSLTSGDIAVSGDWGGVGTWGTGVFRNGLWILEMNGDGRLTNVNQPGWDRAFQYSATPGDLPVTGDWDGDGRWSTGIFRNGAWFLDANGDGILSNINQPGGDRIFQYSATPGDIPVSGDWNGDGKSDTGIFRDGAWFLDVNGDGVLSNINQPGGDRIFQYSATPGDKPVAGDWNGDGIYETGIFRGGVWFLDVNGDGLLSNINQPGGDRIFQYSATPGDQPVVGKW